MGKYGIAFRNASRATRERWRQASEEERAAKAAKRGQPMSFGKLVLAIVVGGWILYALIQAGGH